MSNSTHVPLSPFDRFMVSLDATPIGDIYRMAIGFFSIPALSSITGEDPSALQLLGFLLFVLALLRIAPAIARAILPFSRPVQAIWFERRQLAKQYDSYQWRKILWIGLGLSGQTLVSQKRPFDWMVVAAVCILSGLVGLIRWHSITPRSSSKVERLKQANA